MISDNFNIESIKKNVIKHRQLLLTERENLAKHAIKHGVNNTATLFGKHYETVKRWRDRYLKNEDLNNIETTPLTFANHKYLESLSHLVGNYSLNEIKLKYSLPYSIDTLAKYYRQQNILIKEKHIIIYKCSNCKLWIRSINVFFGRPRNILCPYCGYYKLDRQEYLKIPFFNPRPQDFFFRKSMLRPLNSNYFNEMVIPLLKIPKDLKCLLVYSIKPRKHNRIHLIKYFEKIGSNTIPVTYCSIRFPDIQKREILKPRSREIETGLICQTCQLPYLRDFKKYGDRYPDIKYRSTDPMHKVLELFILAKKNNNKTAYTLMGMSKEEFYKFKKQYVGLYTAIQHLKNEIQ